MARITIEDLRTAVDHVNERMEKVGSPFRFAAQSRNGYKAVDLYKEGRCLHVIASGTAKECIGGLYSLAFDYMYSAAQDRIRELTVARS